MVVYGTGSKDLGEKLITNEKCPNCDALNKIHIHGIAKYVDIFWIPVFPYKKKLIPICHACETEISKKQLTSSLRDKIGLEKSTFKTPLYLFSGLLLIGLLIAWISYSSYKHKNFVGERIHHLQKDDIVVFKHNSKEYSFAVIDSVVNEEIFFRNSNYVIDAKPTKSDYSKGVKEKSDFFNTETYYYTQSEIDSLFTNDKLDIFEK